MVGEVYAVYDATQLNLHDLHIGAGNFARGEYTDEEGETTRGLIAALWILVDGAEEHSEWVHEGQVLIVEDYRIQVVNIDADDMGAFVELDISRLNSEENSP